ncbi:DUF29 family protein [Nostoc sp.]|uniref:DUF29 family protein n=1 Tax=Nostoc sp. TaxID=1180 RepID=UPI002FFCCFFC
MKRKVGNFDLCLYRFLNDAEWINTTYQRARQEVMVETSLSEDNFAIACPFSVNEILDLDFYLNVDE